MIARILLLVLATCGPLLQAERLRAAPPAATSAFTPSAQDALLAQRLEAALRDAERDGFSGAAMVAQGGRLVLAQGYGLADRERRLPATAHTPFQVGSVAKPFTAAAILRLERRGRLRLSDRIGRHLADVPRDKRTITIAQLLTHTSGLRDRASECSSATSAMARDAYVRHVLGARLRAPPGRAFHYSNDGYALLGAIVERASGRDFEDDLREQLFAPAGTARTGYRVDAAVLADAARGYGGGAVFLGSLDPRLRLGRDPAWCNRASGGLFTTAQDMYRLSLALRGNALLPEAALRSMWRQRVREAPRATRHYGFGWSLTVTPRGTRLAAHDGSLSGYYTADLRWYLDEDVVIFVAGNVAEHPAPDVAATLARIVFAPPRTG